MKLRMVRPSPSYYIRLPEGVAEQSDGRVSSFWIDGEPLLLQLSSYVREKGRQPSARSRLRDRMAKHSEAWTIWSAGLHPDDTLDQATAEFIDKNGVLWLHSYLVWPHLAIYITISGPEDLVSNEKNWARQSLGSLRLTTH